MTEKLWTILFAIAGVAAAWWWIKQVKKGKR